MPSYTGLPLKNVNRHGGISPLFEVTFSTRGITNPDLRPEAAYVLRKCTSELSLSVNHSHQGL
jgi:hypothetical protein